MLKAFYVESDRKRGSHASRKIRHALKMQLNKMLRFDWLFHYSGSNTHTDCVTDQTRRATRAGSGYARLVHPCVYIIL